MPRKLARRGGGEVGADPQRKEGKRKSIREGRDFRDAAVPGLGETRLRARTEKATSPLGHASDCGLKATARPVGRRRLPARVLPGLAGAPGVGGANKICRCARGPTMHPGSVTAARGWRVFPGQSGVLPGLANDPGVSGHSTLRRQERRLRETLGNTDGYLKRGESFRHSSKSTVIFILPPSGLAGSTGGATGGEGLGQRWHRGSGRRPRALGRL